MKSLYLLFAGWILGSSISGRIKCFAAWRTTQRQRDKLHLQKNWCFVPPHLKMKLFWKLFICWCSLLQQLPRTQVMDCLEKLFIPRTREHKLNPTIVGASGDNWIDTLTLQPLSLQEATSSNCRDAFFLCAVIWLFLVTFGDFHTKARVAIFSFYSWPLTESTHTASVFCK